MKMFVLKTMGIIQVMMMNNNDEMSGQPQQHFTTMHPVFLIADQKDSIVNRHAVVH